MKHMLVPTKHNFLFFVMALSIMFYFSQCKKKDSVLTVDPPTSGVPYQLLLGNEGNFNQGNSSLSVLKTGATELLNDVFANINSRPLGDVAQAIAVVNNQVFVTLNHSKKIEVMNLSDFKSLASIVIEGGSPEYIVPISDNLIAVSDLYKSVIYIINTQSYQIVQTIKIAQPAKQMLKIGNQLVANMVDYNYSNYPNPPIIEVHGIAVLDISNLSDIKSKTTIAGNSGINISKIVMDKNNNFWILSTDLKLVCIDPNTATKVKEIDLSTLDISNTGGTSLESNFSQDSLFFNTKTGIYAVSINDVSAPMNPLFVYTGKVSTLYNFGVSRNKTIYICDVLDYTQRGILYEFNQKGEKITQYSTGIIPQYLYIF